MIKYFLLILVIIPSIFNTPLIPEKKGEELSSGTILNSPRSIQTDVAKTPHTTDSSEVPQEIVFPSSVGEVNFPHLFHIEDLEMECIACHHQINAKILITPHSDYFMSSWIRCEICHNKSRNNNQKIFTCTECHHSSPLNIADETLSSKVVIHNSCWQCHEVGTGLTAAESCNKCHTGTKI